MTPTPFAQLTVNLAALKTHRPKHAPHQDSLAVMQEASDFAMSWVATFRGKESAVLANKRLSDIGRQEEILKVAVEATADLGPIRRPIEATKEAMQRLRAVVLDYQDLPEGVDKIEALMLSQEVRQEFRGRPQHEKDAAFLQAADRQDRTTMRAFLTAPGGAWIDGEVRQRGDEAYGARRDPAAWAMLQRLERLYEFYVSLGRMIAIALLAYGLESSQVEKALGLTLSEMQIQEPLKSKPVEELVAGKGAARG